MKYYAQFYGLSTGYVAGSIPPVFLESNRAPIPACGDRAVINLDGRMSGWRMECIAADECKKRGFVAYRMMRGDSLREMRNNGPVVRVDHLTNLQTASPQLGVTDMSLLAELNDCRNAGESLAACIVRLYLDETSPMHAAAAQYAASIKPQYRESNPKIDIFRDGTERADPRYVGSTNYYRTCRDALIHKMLAVPGVAFKAVRGK